MSDIDQLIDVHHWSERSRVLVALVVGVIVGTCAALVSPWQLAVIAGWDAMALVFIGWTWLRIGRLDGARTRTHAQREDSSRQASRVLLAIAAVASLAGVITALVLGKHETGTIAQVLNAMSVVTVMCSWVLIQTLFTLRYADLYYGDDPGGIDFNMDVDPDFRDFAYVAFTVGMTFQIADTSVTDPRLRRSVLVHSLLSYVFGTVILGLTINLLASLF